MVRIGNMCGRRCAALITNMDIPLGYSIGNILEVKEAIATLKGDGPDDLTEISVQLAALMTHFALGITKDEALAAARQSIKDGSALLKFKEWINAQGGNPSLIDDPSLFPSSAETYEVKAKEEGYVTEMNAEAIGIAAMALGAGRRTKDDPIDYTAGIILKKKYGDIVKCGETLAVFHTSNKKAIPEAEEIFLGALTLKREKPEEARLIYDTVL
jgi:pyrimidine-nucleoside phosphorylase